MQPLAVITGGNAGIGWHTANQALAEGYALIIGVRSLDKGKQAAERLRQKYPRANVQTLQLDLSDLDSVKKFAESIPRWNLLINNAGAKIERPYKRTAQGFEWHVGVNHLGHFALTALVLPNAENDSAIVTVSSVVARKGQLNFEIGEFDRGQAYANSKYMNLLFGLELAQRLESVERNISSTIAHPGFARASAYGSKLIRFGEYLLAHSAKLGAKSSWAAAKGKNGSYWAPRWFELWGKPREYIKTLDREAAARLWQESEKLTGIEFTI